MIFPSLQSSYKKKNQIDDEGPNTCILITMNNHNRLGTWNKSFEEKTKWQNCTSTQGLNIREEFLLVLTFTLNLSCVTYVAEHPPETPAFEKHNLVEHF